MTVAPRNHNALSPSHLGISHVIRVEMAVTAALHFGSTGARGIATVVVGEQGVGWPAVGGNILQDEDEQVVRVLGVFGLEYPHVHLARGTSGMTTLVGLRCRGVVCFTLLGVE